MMRLADVLRAAVRSLLARRRFDDQLDADLRFHLDQAIDELVRGGLSPEEARREALKAFGNPTRVREDVREVSMWIWWERLTQDLRYGLRGFRRTPAFAATVVLSLALGIGANTAFFSIFNALALRPLPVRDPEALFQVVHLGDGGSSESTTYALYQHLRTEATTIAGAFQVNASTTVRAVVDGQAEPIVAQYVTGDYFEVLGVPPHLGRVIGPHDEQGSTPRPVAVLGHGYWMRRFGGSADVLGSTIAVDGTPYTIVGVSPPDFFGMQVGRRVDVSVPIDGTDEPRFWKSRAIVVRLKPGVSREAAAADLNASFLRYVSGESLPDRVRARAFKSLDLVASSSGLAELRDRYGKPVQAMLAIVTMLLVLGCANLASLFLARAATRQRDLSVCAALGASGPRLARQALSETLFLSVAGGLLGVVAAWWGVDLLTGLLPDFGGSVDLRVRPDGTVLMFSLVATIATGLFTGLAPALLARRIDVRHLLSTGGRSIALGSATFNALIVVQVALSTVLVVAATLFAATLSNLRTLPLGFVADGVLTVTVDADGSGIEGARLAELHRQVLERLETLPGVQHASLATIPPLSSNEDGKPISIPGVTFATPDDGVLQVNTIGPGFFETFGVRILKGRGIAASDREPAQQVAVVSDSMARHYFPGVDPVGRRMDVGRGRTGGQIEIVGVAEDVRYADVRTPTPRIVYVSAFQREAEESMVFALRSAGDPSSLIEAVRREVRAVAPAVLATDVKTLAEQRDERLVNERLLAFLSGGLGVLALLLAAVGVYGVVNYAVTQRTSEFGLRIALGAQRAGLLWLATRGTLVLLAAAVLLGVAVAFATSSWLSSFLFGVRPAELWVYALTVAILLAIGLLSTVGPTLRAMRIDPVETLRWQ
jgi:predicted permease